MAFWSLIGSAFWRGGGKIGGATLWAFSSASDETFEEVAEFKLPCECPNWLDAVVLLPCEFPILEAFLKC